ncbi:FxsA family protein [Qingshengfaniella alkalisoli]|uniref:FxsA family protein n=1 Tax=Qingshengfaniella alkalisoli TaxID=2599296 RepID=A0A5B8J6L9_9RHOB|nr:FxsA family protein [Qingshengfaniella alkalisoli]QDY69980.1 FxsA family protein [Qingshengfaniella alkalisoli]
MWLLLAFIAVPMIEIALFIQVGSLIGLWPTLFIVLATAVIGTTMVRSQGRDALKRLQTSFDRLDNPTVPLAHGAMIILSGALLLTPGFFTDTIGLLLLVPKVRDALFRHIQSRVKIRSFSMGRSQHYKANSDPGVIDGEFFEVDPDSVKPKPTDRPSGWTRS